MTLTTRVVAQGANRFRQPGTVERLGDSLARMPLSPALRRQLKKLYRMALTIQTRGRGLVRELPGGEVIHVLPRYDYLTWNPDEYRAFRGAVTPGMVALDVGANVGAYATLLGRWVGPTGHVYAFEPEPGAFQGLARHIALNDLSSTVIPICSAVGSSSSVSRLLSRVPHGGSRLIAEGDDDRPSIPVQVTTIDEFCASERLTPGFIKIDVEGSELQVLRGARETISRRRGKLALFVEMHPMLWPSIGVRREDVQRELEHQSLTAEALTETGDMWATEGICLRLVDDSLTRDNREGMPSAARPFPGRVSIT